MSEAGPQVNGPASPSGKYIDGIDPDDPQYIKNLQRPAEVKEDLQQMENRSRVKLVLNSQAFKDELEQVVEEQLRSGPYPASLIALQQITDLLLPHSKGSLGSLARASTVIPINDLRGVESQSFAKGEKLLRCKVAALYRLVDLCGWSHGIFNHISARVGPENEHFLLNPFGMLYSEITASTLIKVDVLGDILEPGSTQFGVSKAGFTLHSAIHQARPDIKCIVHLHTPAAVAVSAMKCGLLPMSQEALICGNISYHEYQGVLIDAEQREKVARNLGVHNKIMILRNHGIVACGETIEEAFHFTFNVMAACEAQVKAIPAGLDNIVIPSEEAREQAQRVGNQGGGGVESTGRKWKTGELEFEALMRTLDNSGYRTGYVYKLPQVKQEKKERSNSEVEIPPSSSSFTYVFDGDFEHSKYSSPLKAAMERQKKAYKAGWLTTPNAYKKTEVEEIGTTTPKKITKWVPEADSPNKPGSTPIKIENPNQFAPQGSNPKEFKQKQKSIKKDYYEEKVSAGPQSKILEGISWDEAQRAKDGQLSGAGDQLIVVGAASKGIIQRDHQHNAVVYRQYYAANPFENMSEAEIEQYQAEVQRREKAGEPPLEVPVPAEAQEAPYIQSQPAETQQETEVGWSRAQDDVNGLLDTSRTSQSSQGCHPPSEEKLLAQLADKVVQTVIRDALSVVRQGKGQQTLTGAEPSHQHYYFNQQEMGSQIYSNLRDFYNQAHLEEQYSSENESLGKSSEEDIGYEAKQNYSRQRTERSHAYHIRNGGMASCASMAAGMAAERDRCEAQASDPEDDFVMLQLDPIQLYHGQAQSGIMKVKFSIQSTVRRRIRAEVSRGGSIEEIFATATEPIIEHFNADASTFEQSEVSVGQNVYLGQARVRKRVKRQKHQWRDKNDHQEKHTSSPESKDNESKLVHTSEDNWGRFQDAKAADAKPEVLTDTGMDLNSILQNFERKDLVSTVCRDAVKTSDLVEEKPSTAEQKCISPSENQKALHKFEPVSIEEQSRQGQIDILVEDEKGIVSHIQNTNADELSKKNPGRTQTGNSGDGKISPGVVSDVSSSHYLSNNNSAYASNYQNTGANSKTPQHPEDNNESPVRTFCTMAPPSASENLDDAEDLMYADEGWDESELEAMNEKVELEKSLPLQTYEKNKTSQRKQGPSRSLQPVKYRKSKRGSRHKLKSINPPLSPVKEEFDANPDEIEEMEAILEEADDSFERLLISAEDDLLCSSALDRSGSHENLDLKDFVGAAPMAVEDDFEVACKSSLLAAESQPPAEPSTHIVPMAVADEFDLRDKSSLSGTTPEPSARVIFPTEPKPQWGPRNESQLAMGKSDSLAASYPQESDSDDFDESGTTDSDSESLGERQAEILEEEAVALPVSQGITYSTATESTFSVKSPPFTTTPANSPAVEVDDHNTKPQHVDIIYFKRKETPVDKKSISDISSLKKTETSLDAVVVSEKTDPGIGNVISKKETAINDIVPPSEAETVLDNNPLKKANVVGSNVKQKKSEMVADNVIPIRVADVAKQDVIRPKEKQTVIDDVIQLQKKETDDIISATKVETSLKHVIPSKKTEDEIDDIPPRKFETAIDDLILPGKTETDINDILPRKAETNTDDVIQSKETEITIDDVIPPKQREAAIIPSKKIETAIDDVIPPKQREAAIIPSKKIETAIDDVIPPKQREAAIIPSKKIETSIDDVIPPKQREAAIIPSKKIETSIDDIIPSTKAESVINDTIHPKRTVIPPKAVETAIDDIIPSTKTETNIDDVMKEKVVIENAMHANTSPMGQTENVATRDDIKADFAHPKPNILHLDDGPIQTSSPKLGRAISKKESPFKSYPQKLGKSEETLLDIMPLDMKNLSAVAKSHEGLEDSSEEDCLKLPLSRTSSLGPHHKNRVKKRGSRPFAITTKSKETLIDDDLRPVSPGKENAKPKVLDEYHLMKHNEMMQLPSARSIFKPPVIVAYPVTPETMPPLPDTTEVPSISDTEGRQRIEQFSHPPRSLRSKSSREGTSANSNVDIAKDSSPKRKWVPKQKREKRSHDTGQRRDDQHRRGPDKETETVSNRERGDDYRRNTRNERNNKENETNSRERRFGQTQPPTNQDLYSQDRELTDDGRSEVSGQRNRQEGRASGRYERSNEERNRKEGERYKQDVDYDGIDRRNRMVRMEPEEDFDKDHRGRNERSKRHADEDGTGSDLSGARSDREKASSHSSKVSDPTKDPKTAPGMKILSMIGVNKNQAGHKELREKDAEVSEQKREDGEKRSEQLKHDKARDLASNAPGLSILSMIGKADGEKQKSKNEALEKTTEHDIVGSRDRRRRQDEDIDQRRDDDNRYRRRTDDRDRRLRNDNLGGRRSEEYSYQRRGERTREEPDKEYDRNNFSRRDYDEMGQDSKNASVYSREKRNEKRKERQKEDKILKPIEQVQKDSTLVPDTQDYHLHSSNVHESTREKEITPVDKFLNSPRMEVDVEKSPRLNRRRGGAIAAPDPDEKRRHRRHRSEEARARETDSKAKERRSDHLEVPEGRSLKQSALGKEHLNVISRSNTSIASSTHSRSSRRSTSSQRAFENSPEHLPPKPQIDPLTGEPFYFVHPLMGKSTESLHSIDRDSSRRKQLYSEYQYDETSPKQSRVVSEVSPKNSRVESEVLSKVDKATSDVSNRVASELQETKTRIAGDIPEKEKSAVGESMDSKTKSLDLASRDKIGKFDKLEDYTAEPPCHKKTLKHDDGKGDEMKMDRRSDGNKEAEKKRAGRHEDEKKDEIKRDSKSERTEDEEQRSMRRNLDGEGKGRKRENEKRMDSRPVDDMEDERLRDKMYDEDRDAEKKRDRRYDGEKRKDWRHAEDRGYERRRDRRYDEDREPEKRKSRRHEDDREPEQRRDRRHEDDREPERRRDRRHEDDREPERRRDRRHEEEQEYDRKRDRRHDEDRDTDKRRDRRRDEDKDEKRRDKRYDDDREVDEPPLSRSKRTADKEDKDVAEKVEDKWKPPDIFKRDWRSERKPRAWDGEQAKDKNANFIEEDMDDWKKEFDLYQQKRRSGRQARKVSDMKKMHERADDEMESEKKPADKEGDSEHDVRPSKSSDEKEEDSDVDDLLADNPLELTAENAKGAEDEHPPLAPKKGIFSLLSCVGGRSSAGMNRKSKSKKPMDHYVEGEKRKIKKLSKEKKKEAKSTLYFQESDEEEDKQVEDLPAITDESAVKDISREPIPETMSEEPHFKGRHYEKRSKSFQDPKPLSTFVDPISAVDPFAQGAMGETSSEEDLHEPQSNLRPWHDGSLTPLAEESSLSSFRSSTRKEEKQVSTFRSFGHSDTQHLSRTRDQVDHGPPEKNVEKSESKTQNEKEEIVKEVEDKVDEHDADEVDGDMLKKYREPRARRDFTSNSRPRKSESPEVNDRSMKEYVGVETSKLLAEELDESDDLPLPPPPVDFDVDCSEDEQPDLLNSSAPAYISTQKLKTSGHKNVFGPAHDHADNLDDSPQYDTSFDQSASFDTSDVNRVKLRSVSFDDGYSPTMSKPPIRRRISETSMGTGSLTSRSRSNSTTSNPLNYEPWRAKARKRSRSMSISDMMYARGVARPRKSNSIGEISYNSTVASSVARRRSRTPSSGDIISRMYQPRQRSRSRASLGDTSFGSVAPARQRRISRESLSHPDNANSARTAEPAVAVIPVKRSDSERQPVKSPQMVEELDRKNVERSKSDRRPHQLREELGDNKPASPSKSDTMRSTDSASGGETLEERSSKEGSPTKEHPSPTKEKKKKKKFRIPSFSKKKNKESKESAI